MLIFIGGNNMPVYKDKNKGTWYAKYTMEDLPTDLSFIFAIHIEQLKKV